MSWLDEVCWNADGLAPAIAQEATTAKVLTLAWMNRDALSRTDSSGFAHYWSRSRQRLWKKGEASGHLQRVVEIRLDCDRDAILLIVDQAGGIACHTGRERCFYKRLENGGWHDVEPVLKDPKAIYPPASGARGQASATAEARTAPERDVLATLAATIESRKGADPGTSYVASLFAGGDDVLLKKIGEEATETVLAAQDGDRAHLVAEVADLWFHCLVLLARHDAGPDDVLVELARRQGRSGLDEKASRPPQG